MELVVFIVTCIVVESAVDLLKYGFHYLRYGNHPPVNLPTYTNRVVKWFVVNGLETLTVIILVYKEYSIPCSIVVALCATLVLEEISNYRYRRSL